MIIIRSVLAAEISCEFAIFALWFHLRSSRVNSMRISLLVSLLVIFASASMAQDAVLIEDAADVTSHLADDPLQLKINEWPVPWKNTRPRDPDLAPDGSIWLVGQGGDYVARFDPASEEFSRHELPRGTGPHTVIVDRNGLLWIAGNRQAYIGRMDPNTGELTRFTMPDKSARDPHTMVFSGPDEIWFTLQLSNYVGRLDKRNGDVDLVAMESEGARPYGIKMDSKGRPWIALLGTHGLATIDPATRELKVAYLPRKAARLRRLAITRDDIVWYTDYSEGYFGSYYPQTGEFKEWKTPSEKSGPYAMAADKQGRIWFVETSPDPNQLVGFDPQSETIFSVTPIPSGAGSVRHMVYDQQSNSLWFGTDTNNLAQAMLP